MTIPYPENFNHNSPSIFVTCINSLNNTGELYGKWIDCTQEAITIQKDIDDVVAKSGSKKGQSWKILDTKNFVSVSDLNELSIEKIKNLAAIVYEHGDVLCLLAHEYFNDDVLRASKYFGSDYLGSWNSMEDFISKHLFNLQIETEDATCRKILNCINPDCIEGIYDQFYTVIVELTDYATFESRNCEDQIVRTHVFNKCNEC